MSRVNGLSRIQFILTSSIYANAAMIPVTPELLQEATRRLVAEFHPEEVILFGSRAWGEPTADSDVDLLVIVRDSAEKPVKRSIRARRSLIGLPFAKDVLVKTRYEFDRYRNIKASLEHRISEQGKVLYGPGQD